LDLRSAMRTVAHIGCQHSIAHLAALMLLLIDLIQCSHRKSRSALCANIACSRLRATTGPAYLHPFHCFRTKSEFVWISKRDSLAFLHFYTPFPSIRSGFTSAASLTPYLFFKQTNVCFASPEVSFAFSFPYRSLFLHFLQNISFSTTFSPQCGQ